METYQYAFTYKGGTYYVYAPSKEEAIKDFLEEHEFSELPKGCKITRTNG